MHHQLKWLSNEGKVNALTIMQWSCYVSSSCVWPSIQKCFRKEVKPFTAWTQGAPSNTKSSDHAVMSDSYSAANAKVDKSAFSPELTKIEKQWQLVTILPTHIGKNMTFEAIDKAFAKRKIVYSLTVQELVDDFARLMTLIPLGGVGCFCKVLVTLCSTLMRERIPE
ncbi:unnamed protein product [Sphenostylis stenocarpa]|uniref:Uncharacterized protein n=1 Tax=Sphenostylis stenocarpa TaxID=92480 RepID=A0AA86SL55_9FABA|nr:unnamed protein product [Sphenostylis stenocarpa]